VNRQIGVKDSKFLVVAGPLHSGHVTQSCPMAIFVYISGLNIVMAVTQETVNIDTSYLASK